MDYCYHQFLLCQGAPLLLRLFVRIPAIKAGYPVAVEIAIAMEALLAVVVFPFGFGRLDPNDRYAYENPLLSFPSLASWTACSVALFCAPLRECKLIIAFLICGILYRAGCLAFTLQCPFVWNQFTSELFLSLFFVAFSMKEMVGLYGTRHLAN